jgi:hypothetical protein
VIERERSRDNERAVGRVSRALENQRWRAQALANKFVFFSVVKRLKLALAMYTETLTQMQFAESWSFPRKRLDKRLCIVHALMALRVAHWIFLLGLAS